MNEEQAILKVENLVKRYKDFCLDHISFQVPRGAVYGVIGENGAGKSTTISAILDMIKLDGGAISVFGKDHSKCANQIKQKIGVVIDGLNQIPFLYCRDLDKVMKRVYQDWDSGQYFAYLEKFQLPGNKKIKDLSKGMNVKLNFAVALSHHPELLIMDEATSGLDPVMRDDILEILREFVMDENHSIFMSTHITSDLDKIADYVLFLHQGKILFVKTKEELDNDFGIINCGKGLFETLSPEDYVAYIKDEFSYRVLVDHKQDILDHIQNLTIEKASVEEIMLFYVKGVMA